MRILIGVLLIIFFGFLAQIYLPWWTIVVLSFLIGFSVHKKWYNSMISGFLGVGLLWMFMIIYQTIGNQGVLTARMTDLLGAKNPIILSLVCITLGAFLGALGSFTGYSLRFISGKKIRKNKYQ